MAYEAMKLPKYVHPHLQTATSLMKDAEWSW